MYIFQVIHVSLDHVELECGHDWVELYDGATEDAHLMGRYCTSSQHPPLSSSNQMFIKMRTDHSVTSTGFSITWNAGTV